MYNPIHLVAERGEQRMKYIRVEGFLLRGYTLTHTSLNFQQRNVNDIYLAGFGVRNLGLSS